MVAVDDDGLTPNARGIADMIGLEATLLLCESFGGEYVRIPKTMSEFGALLTKTIGHDACTRLMRAYGGDKLFVPRLTGRALMMRNERIIEERRNRAGMRDIARRHNLSMRQLYNILSEAA